MCPFRVFDPRDWVGGRPVKSQDSTNGFTLSPWPVLRNSIVHTCDNARPHTVYGSTQIDFTDAYERIREVRRATRVSVSIHAFVLGCVAKAAAEFPMLRSHRQGKNLVRFDTVDVGTIIDQVASDAMRTRLPVLYIVRDADRKSIAEINWEIRAAARRDLGNDPMMKFRRRLSRLPQLAQKVIFRRLMNDPWKHRQVFGTFGFTSIQSPGYNLPAHAFVTNICNGTVAMGNLYQSFLPDSEGRPVLRRVLDISGAFDHDYIDGMLIMSFGRLATKLITSGYGLDEEFIRETLEFASAEKAARLTQGPEG